MATLDFTKATLSDMENRVDDFEVAAKSTDGVSDQKETEYINTRWTQQWGYFTEMPDLKSAIIMKATWITGRGYKADAAAEVELNHISGWGKDTFLDVIFNMEIIKRVGGDAYAERIGSEDEIVNGLHKFKGKLINLKPLDTGSIRIVVSGKGILKRYEQVNKIGGKKEVQHKFHPNKIFHLSHNRIADQIHGISDIDAVEKTLLANGESFDDVKKIMHRQARTMIMFKLGTDNQEEIDDFIRKMDKAVSQGDNIYIPDDGNTVSYEVVQINVSSLILAWRDDIRNKFYRTIGLPQVVPGAGGNSTESESKVIYLAFEQLVEKDQLALEKQIWNQLFLKLDFIHPASIQENLNKDESKDAGQAFQPKEITI